MGYYGNTAIIGVSRLLILKLVPQRALKINGYVYLTLRSTGSVAIT